MTRDEFEDVADEIEDAWARWHGRGSPGRYHEPPGYLAVPSVGLRLDALVRALAETPDVYAWVVSRMARRRARPRQRGRPTFWRQSINFVLGPAREVLLT